MHQIDDGSPYLFDNSYSEITCYGLHHKFMTTNFKQDPQSNKRSKKFVETSTVNRKRRKKINTYKRDQKHPNKEQIN